MKVVYGDRALLDLDRLADFILAQDTLDPAEAIETIIEAIGVLGRSPFVGRPVIVAGRPFRELVISYGKTGYVALYRVKRDAIEVLAIRHQREAGYSDR